MDHNNSSSHLHRQLDWVTTLIPFGAILVLCLLFLLAPEQSGQVLSSIRFFLGDELGSYYLLIGLGVFLCSLYIAFSPYGQIRLGDREKPQYSSFQWGSMMFTAGLAADILFYSLCEWILYAGEDRISQMGSIQDWASTYPLFHWGPIPWSFYLVLASAFGFMLHVRKCDKQKYSEACRPLLGRRVDGFWGKLIDLLAVFALLAGTATTFSLATPLLSMAISHVFHIPASNLLTIGLLAIIGITYTIAVYFGMKGVSKLASSCTYLFFALLLYVLIGGGKARYTIETGITAIGNLTQNFIGLCTWTDALRTSSFPQSKRELWRLRDCLHIEADKMGLTIKSSERVAPISAGMDALGYVNYGSHTLLRKRIKVNAARKLSKLKSRKRRQQIIGSFKGMACHADCKHLFYILTKKNMKKFSEMGVTYTPADGKKRFPGKVTRLSDIVNIPIEIHDFETGIDTKEGENRYLVSFRNPAKQEWGKFFTASAEMKGILDQVSDIEDGFPFETIIKGEVFDGGKRKYNFT